MKGKEAVCMLCLVFIANKVLSSPVLSLKKGGSKNHINKETLRDGSVTNEDSNELLNESSSTKKDDEQLLEDPSASRDDKNQALDDGSAASGETSQQLEDATSSNDDNVQLTESSELDGSEGPDPKEKRKKERRLKIGDYVSPQDFFAVSEKLIKKVENPGEGKGIVSSSKNPKILSEKLFKSFFGVPNRLAIVKDNDLAGIDALQALALSGEEVTSLEDNYGDLNSKGLDSKTDSESKYDVMKKRIDNLVEDRSSEDRNQKEETPKLQNKDKNNLSGKPKKRCFWRYKCPEPDNIDSCKLKAYCGNEHKPKKKEEKKKKPKNKNKSKRRNIQSGSECRWSYKCTNDIDLTTCHLVPKCTPKETSVHEIYLPHQKDELSPQMKNFRKMLGISLIDEEVEKILERRILQDSGLGAEQRIESLSEYFHNLLKLEQQGSNEASTKSMSYEGTDNSSDEGGVLNDNVTQESEHEDENQQEVTFDSEDQDENQQEVTLVSEDQDKNLQEKEKEEDSMSTNNDSSKK